MQVMKNHINMYFTLVENYFFSLQRIIYEIILFFVIKLKMQRNELRKKYQYQHEKLQFLMKIR